MEESRIASSQRPAVGVRPRNRSSMTLVEMQEARASERVTNPRRWWWRMSRRRRRLRRRVVAAAAVVVVAVGVRHRPGRRVWTYLKSGWMGAVFSRKRERPGEGGGDVGLVSLNLHHRRTPRPAAAQPPPPYSQCRGRREREKERSVGWPGWGYA